MITSTIEPIKVSRQEVGIYYQYTVRFNISHDEEEWTYEEIELPAGKWGKNIITKSIISLYYSDNDVNEIVNNALQDPTNARAIIAYKNLQTWREQAAVWAKDLMQYAYDNELSLINPNEVVIHYNNPKPEGRPEWFTMVSDGLKLLQKQALTLTDEEAAEVPTLFPAWIDYIGQQVNEGERYYYNGSLWKVLQQHIVVEEVTPESAPELYTSIFYASGTSDHPISILNLDSYGEGTYYTDGKKLFIGENIDGEVQLVAADGAIPRTLP